MAMKKVKLTLIDGIIALIIGELLAWLLVPIFENLNLDISVWWGAILLPILSLLGLFVCYLFGLLWSVFYQIGKFSLIGILNTLVDWGILNFLMWTTGIMVGVGYSAFKGISFIVATVNSYFWSKFWVFKKNKSKEIKREAGEFFAVSVIGFLINIGVASWLVNFVSPPNWKIIEGVNISAFWGNIGALLGTLTAMAWNFAGYKLMVFKK